MKELWFALPAGNLQISGGNIYNAGLIEALRPLARVRTTSLAGCRADLAQGVAGVYFIDSLDLGAMAGFPPAGPGQALVLIAHHLPSLEPDLDPGDAALQVERAALPRFDAWLATSPFTAEWLAARGCARERILTVAPAAPEIAGGDGDGGADGDGEASVRGLLVGNLIPRKAVRELLQALAAELRDGDRLSLEIVGRADIDPAYAAACANLVRQHAALRARVTLAGPLPHPRLFARYRRANLFVSASGMETFGMALQEARAAGLPILALDAGYARHHFTDGDDGLLCDSVAALAAALLGLARDPPRLRRLADRARASRPTAGYTWTDAARRLLAELARCGLGQN